LLVGEAITQANWYTWTLGYGYDANGHLASETYPDGLTVAFAPNALGQPTQAGSYAASAAYAPDGGLAGFTYGNGIQRMRAENVRGLPSAITDTGNGVTPIQQSYLYDADGDPVSITDAANAAQARSLTYDGQDRLATSVVGAQGSAPTGYRYDVLDNLTAVQRGTAVRTYGYDASNRLTQVNDPAAGNIALTWDARGNIATRGSQRYAFDGANRLQWVWGGESYRYDALGRRILAWSFADSQNILSMYSHAGTLVHQDNQREGGLQHDFIYLGNQLVAIVDTAPGGQRSVRYQHTDAQGTVAAQTDGNRVVLSRSVYADYGMAQDHANDDQPGYTGHLQDSLTGLTYMQQRYYDPTLQRFLSPDPVQTDPHTGASFNRYEYANDNPYRYTDPDGQDGTEALGGLFYESWSFVTGNGFHGGRIWGALKDGYNGEGGGALHALAQDATTLSVAAGGLGALRAAGSLALREGASEGLGVVYRRINPHTLEEYVGQAKSFARYLARQGEHDRALGVKHEYEILGRAEPGNDLRYLEETQIRANGGLQKEGGTLANKIHAMSSKKYDGFQGVFRVQGRLDSIKLRNQLDGK